MSFHGNISDARAAINSVEETPSIRSSKIKSGHSNPGVHNKAAGETQHVGRLREGIKTPKTKTGSLKRKYAAS